VFYPFNPMDVVGWKGDLAVWNIKMRDMRPIMSQSRASAAQRASTFVTEDAV
jgi:homogentisate 1,2-dioxygenase